MKPVDQTRFSIEPPLTEAPGNCWAACIASILELPLDQVPDEAETWQPGMTHRQSWRLYYPKMLAWLLERNMTLLEVWGEVPFFSANSYQPFCILSGPSYRNSEYKHAVVCLGDKLVHDPHPSRKGVLRGDLSKLSYEFFLVLDPSKVRA